MQYVFGERRVYIFLYGHSLNLILKYGLALKVKMIALVIYVPHKTFTTTTTGWPLLWKPEECAENTYCGRGLAPTFFSHAELYSLMQDAFFVFVFNFLFILLLFFCEFWYDLESVF